MIEDRRGGVRLVFPSDLRCGGRCRHDRQNATDNSRPHTRWAVPPDLRPVPIGAKPARRREAGKAAAKEAGSQFAKEVGGQIIKDRLP
ncbi:hypothetical protein [Mitsuaria sp. BK037]|uniref:hypothetical protein n=1 Tax=Mitsuaria sp. BK037 TaxID=2587122 RepID=UPI00160F11A5|nr:hypothetical protein [Mitsuaria sp. BK037]MBB3281736.1 hypothetical protein [Mitsuaria sp. BK037]